MNKRSNETNKNFGMSLMNIQFLLGVICVALQIKLSFSNRNLQSNM